jgi:hypothetical protein
MQEAFIPAMNDWAQHGLPANPSGWLLTAARNPRSTPSGASARVGSSPPTWPCISRVSGRLRVLSATNSAVFFTDARWEAD